MGPIPTEEGGLSFTIRLENGREHDIDELSSGEKEVLLGYLRLRNNAPRNSIILLDEPELHLNPRLTRGLPRFYQKHLGEALNNQLWLITHSDALLREAVEEPAYVVYHMQPAYATDQNANQSSPVSASAEVERVLIDLVGDLATYSPRSKVVILEGGGDSDVDLRVVTHLFPLFAEQVNLVSGGNKYGVKTLQVLLDKVAEDGKLDARFYSIVDQDYDGPDLVTDNHQHSWNVYHIENYLLEPRFIQKVLNRLALEDVSYSEHVIEDRLQEYAKETIDSLIKIQMNKWVYQHLITCISTKFNPSMDLVQGFREAAERSSQQIQKALDKKITESELIIQKEKFETELVNALECKDWKTRFRGRDILKRFVGKAIPEIKYERFRNLIINEMRDEGYQPPGMQQVIEAILGN